MRFTFGVSAIFFALVATGCQTTGPVQSSWSMEEKLLKFRDQTHHWGQKGQVFTNNGWTEYGKLKLVSDGPDYIVFSQRENELVAEVFSNDSADPKLRAVSIPGAGLFYSPKEEHSCRPDAIEQLGIYAEMALFYLSNLYPNGPVNLEENNSSSASGGPVELRFMQAVARISENWKVESKLEKLSGGKYSIEISKPNKGRVFLVEWEKSSTEVLASTESLSNWATCWSGVSSTDKEGNRFFKTNVPNTDSILTFGEIRGFRGE